MLSPAVMLPAVLAVLFFCGSSVWAQSPPPGYLVLAQFRCNDSLIDCQSWSFDVIRQDYFIYKNETIPMEYLEPPAPRDKTMYQVLTAINNITREFYVSAARPNKQAELWAVTFDDLVEQSQISNNTVITYPKGTDKIVRIHASPSGDLLAIFDNGAVYAINMMSGDLSLVGSVLPVSNPDGWSVTEASAVDYEANELYSVAYKVNLTSNATSAHAVRLDLESGKSKMVAIVGSGPVKGNPWQYELLFHAMWVPILRQLVVLAHDLNGLGRDQILLVDPVTGILTAWVPNLGDKGYYFNNIPVFRVDNMKQMAVYDYLQQRIYFECSQNPAEQTVVAYLDVLAQGNPPTTQFSLAGIGYVAFQFIPVINN